MSLNVQKAEVAESEKCANSILQTIVLMNLYSILQTIALNLNRAKCRWRSRSCEAKKCFFTTQRRELPQLGM